MAAISKLKRSCRWNLQASRKPLARPRGEGEAPAFLIRHLHEEAQAEPLSLAEEALLAGFPDPLEGLAEDLELVGFEAALVAHLDEQAAAGPPGFQGDPPLPVGQGVLDQGE